MHCVFINMFCLLTNVLMKQGIENIKINMISKTCVLTVEQCAPAYCYC